MPTRSDHQTDAPIDRTWLRDLWAYARQQAGSPAGQAAVAALGLPVTAMPDGLGYLPTDYTQAVPSAHQDWCRDHLPAGSLVRPLLHAGTVVGLETWTPPAAATADVEAEAGALRLVPDSTDHGRCWCEAGELRIGIDSPATGSVRLVHARRGERLHRDRFDLTVGAQVRRFAASAALRCGLPAAVLEAQVGAAWALVRDHEEAQDHPAPVAVAEAERADALRRLRDPGLLDRVADDLTALGWIGDTATKHLLYLTAISRFLPSPVWSLYQATAGAAPWRDLAVLASLMPPEDCVVFHRVTESLLRQTDNRALRHKLLLIDRAETLRPEAALALRILHERGALGAQALPVATNSGNLGNPGIPWMREVRGPVAVLAAATGPIDSRCRDCLLTVTVDESPAQTSRILDAQRRARSGCNPVTDSARAIALRQEHYALQRLLARDPVRIPFSDRISFPIGSVRYRQEQAVLLTLIEASALLHQYQRERDTDGAILATDQDFAHALASAGHLLGQYRGGLSRQAHALMRALAGQAVAPFTMRNLAGLLPDWTRYAYRSALAELIDLGHVEATEGGRGRERSYLLTAHALRAGGISLLPPGVSAVPTSVGELAMVGERVSPTAIPVARVG